MKNIWRYSMQYGSGGIVRAETEQEALEKLTKAYPCTPVETVMLWEAEMDDDYKGNDVLEIY